MPSPSPSNTLGCHVDPPPWAREMPTRQSQSEPSALPPHPKPPAPGVPGVPCQRLRSLLSSPLPGERETLLWPRGKGCGPLGESPRPAPRRAGTGQVGAAGHWQGCLGARTPGFCKGIGFPCFPGPGAFPKPHPVCRNHCARFSLPPPALQPCQIAPDPGESPQGSLLLPATSLSAGSPLAWHSGPPVQHLQLGVIWAFAGSARPRRSPWGRRPPPAPPPSSPQLPALLNQAESVTGTSQPRQTLSRTARATGPLLTLPQPGPGRSLPLPALRSPLPGLPPMHSPPPPARLSSPVVGGHSLGPLLTPLPVASTNPDSPRASSNAWGWVPAEPAGRELPGSWHVMGVRGRQQERGQGQRGRGSEGGCP